MREITQTRKGSVLIVVLVCLGFAATLMMGALRMGLQQRRQSRNERDLLQTEWLLDAGVRLAVQKLTADKDFDGQTATFDQGLQPEHEGVIKIQVYDQPDEKDSRLVSVVATLERAEGQFAIKRSHQFEFPSSKSAIRTLNNSTE